MIWNVEPAQICHIFTSVKLEKDNLEKESSTSIMIINNNSWYEKPVFEVTIYMVTATAKQANPTLIFHKHMCVKYFFTN